MSSNSFRNGTHFSSLTRTDKQGSEIGLFQSKLELGLPRPFIAKLSNITELLLYLFIYFVNLLLLVCFFPLKSKKSYMCNDIKPKQIFYFLWIKHIIRTTGSKYPVNENAQ
jgi:hypothetical protein